MKLTIALTAASVVLKFTTPGPGTYYVLTSIGDYKVKIEASNHVKKSSHVSVPLPKNADFKLYWIEFIPSGEPDNSHIIQPE